MTRIKEAFYSARERLHAGHAITTPLGWATPYIATPLSSGVAYALNESREQIDPDLFRIITISAIALINTISVARESRTIREQGYSASTTTNTLNVLTGRQLEASIGGHALGFAQLAAISPTTGIALFSGNSELLTDSAAAALATTAGMRIGLNTLILQGRIEPLIKGVRNVKESVAKKFKKVDDSENNKS